MRYSNEHSQHRGTMRCVLPVLAASVWVALQGCTGLTEVHPKMGCDLNPVRSLGGAHDPGPALVSALPGSVTDIPLNTVNITDRAITNKIVVHAAWGERTPVGGLRASARLVNCTDHPLQIEGRTHFLDAQHRPVEHPTAWRRVHLEPRSIADYSAVSTAGAGAVSFLIDVREGR